MAFFIQSQRTSPFENIGYFLCTGESAPESGVGGGLATYIGQQPATTTLWDTLPPVPSSPLSAFIRCYIYPLDSSDPTIFGLFTHFYGRRYWAMMAPTYTSLNMRFYVGDFPPAGPHPAKFKISGEVASKLKYIYSPFYSKYFQANTVNGGFTLVSNTSDSLCWYNFWGKTSCGPVIPTPLSYSVATEDAQYFIVSRYGKALTASAVSSPYLSQATINFSAVSQKFFFRAQTTPSPAASSYPFCYNIFFVGNPDTMLCFEDNGSIGIRTVAGSWEQLFIAPGSANDTEPELFGRFKIQSFELGIRLTASSDGLSITTKAFYEPETPNDYFSFIPVAVGIPYTTESGDSPIPAPIFDHPDGTIVDLPDGTIVDLPYCAPSGPDAAATVDTLEALDEVTAAEASLPSPATCRLLGRISGVFAAILYFLLSFFLLPVRAVGFWASYAFRKPEPTFTVPQKHGSA